MGNAVIVVVGGVICGVYLFSAIQIPSTVGDPIGPRSFPYIISAGLFISLGWLILETLRERLIACADDSDESKVYDVSELFVLGIVVVSSLIYIQSLEFLGFIIATSIYLFALSSLLDLKRWRLNAVVAVTVSLSLFGLFVKVLSANLPAGSLFN